MPPPQAPELLETAVMTKDPFSRNHACARRCTSCLHASTAKVWPAALHRGYHTRKKMSVYSRCFPERYNFKLDGRVLNVSVHLHPDEPAAKATRRIARSHPRRTLRRSPPKVCRQYGLHHNNKLPPKSRRRHAHAHAHLNHVRQAKTLRSGKLLEAVQENVQSRLPFVADEQTDAKSITSTTDNSLVETHGLRRVRHARMVDAGAR